MPTQAPVVVFAYKRAKHLDLTLRGLKNCIGFADSQVIVFCDGPKAIAERAAVDETRRVAHGHLGGRAEYRFSDVNRGLSASIMAGLAEVTNRFGRIIVVEDDLEVTSNFLTYMNSALIRYEHHTNVYQVSGHMFDTPELTGRGSALFLPFTTTWGWATWRRAWSRFDPWADGWKNLRTDPGLRNRFNLGGAYDYASMLERQMTGVGDSWGIRWYWSTFRDGGLVCFPPNSLVRNTGMDGSGTHGRGVFRHFKGGISANASTIVLPEHVAIDRSDLHAVTKAIRRHNGGWIGSAADRIRSLILEVTKALS